MSGGGVDPVWAVGSQSHDRECVVDVAAGSGGRTGCLQSVRERELPLALLQ